MIERNSEVVLRKVGGFYFLVDPGKSYNSEMEDIFQTNEIGAAIWNLLENHKEICEVHQNLILLLTDDVNDELSEQIRDDIISFVGQLKQNGFVTEV